MTRVVVLGAGVSGHTAAAFLKRWLNKTAEVTVVSPKSHYNWLPSNIWVGVGQMKPRQVLLELAPVYKKLGVDFRQANAGAIHPEGTEHDPRPFVEIEYTDNARAGQTERVHYDYLINATGPKLNFGATPGLGPDRGHTLSVCTAAHAEHTWDDLSHCIGKMKQGQRQRFLVGTGHGKATCQGAAFEYITNLEFILRHHGVRDQADITWLSNESCLGDFGMGGLYLKRGGYVTHSKVFAESLFAERGLGWITQAHIKNIEKDHVSYETLSGEQRDEPYDFAMLLPPFCGVGLTSIDKHGNDISDTLFAANGFMKVDADYTPRPYEQWCAEDWPRYYQNPDYDNLYAVGIAFAPPHPISRPRTSPNGTPIFATPPRTGMPSAMIGKAVARNITDRVLGRDRPAHPASMARMGAACVASAGASALRGTAVSMTVFPIVPDYKAYPEYGRDLSHTFGEIGLAGHWIKNLLHHMFIYKAKAKPFWWLIPE